MKKLLIVLTLVLSMLHAGEYPKFDPATYNAEQAAKYEAQLVKEDKAVQANLKSLVKECKIRSERAKKYKAFLDTNPWLNKKLSDSVIKSCQERVTAVCGAIMDASRGIETNTTARTIK